MIFKLSFLALLATIPFFEGAPIYGVPFWAVTSLSITFVYALLILLSIEFEWEQQKGDDHG